MKNYEKRCFVRVWTSFGPWSNLGLTRGILVISAEKCTSGASVPKRVVPHHFGYSCRPLEKKIIFLDFSRSGMQIEGKQNTVSTQIITKEIPKELQFLVRLHGN